jgi:hypothetical protein
MKRGWQPAGLDRKMVVRFLGVFLISMAGYSETLGSLCKFAGLTNSECKQVESGAILSKTLPTTHKRELAIAGVARARVSRACFLEKFRDIEIFKKSPAVRQIGRFSSPVSLTDLAALTLDSQDMDALRTCGIGDCGVKVPISALQRLALPEPEEATANDVARVNSVFREELLRYIQTYLSFGDQSLIQYQDKSKPLRLSEEFLSMLAGWTELNQLRPELGDFLTRGPLQPLPFLEEFLYWSKESFGLKPVISVTHVTIYQLPDQAWIASKQIYASHYFDASLAVTLVFDDPGDRSGNTVYLAYVNRSRIDLLGGAFSGLARSMVRGRLEDGMRKNLQQTVMKLESSVVPPTNESGRPAATH